jgi:hypothetical protein
MHSLQVLALAGVASAGHIAVEFTRERFNFHLPISITKRQNNTGGSDSGILLEAVNNMTGGGYYSEFSIGTPPQKLGFLLDTGSSDTWVNSVDSDLCSSSFQQSQNGYCMDTFDPDKSSTFEEVDRNGFDITYLDGRNILGDYFNDTVTIGGMKVENQQLGLALESVRPTGIMGLGFSKNVAATREYPTIVDNMVAQGHIDTAAYSLYLNSLDSDSGNILFGAIDQKKFIGELATMPLHGDDLSGSDEPAHFNIQMTGFSANTPDNDLDLGTLKSGAILDSGSTICLLPDAQVSKIHTEFDIVSIQGVLAPFADCAWRGDKGKDYSFDFKFGSKTIRVPLREMVVNAFDDVQDQIMSDPSTARLFGDWEGVCIFGIGSTANFGFTESDDFTLLGDTFLRSAYVVYDLANEQLGLAQANLDSDETDIVEIKSGDLPKVKGVEGQSNDNSSGDDDKDAAILLSNPFRGGLPAAVTFMALMGALMVAL